MRVAVFPASIESNHSWNWRICSALQPSGAFSRPGGTFPSGDPFAATIYATNGSNGVTVENANIKGEIQTAGAFYDQTDGRPAVFSYYGASDAAPDSNITVTGCTPGTAAKRTRPAAAAAPSVAINASSLAESGPRSRQATPAASNANATSSSDRPSCERSTAAHTAAAKAAPPATKSAALDKECFLPECDRPVGHDARELLVVRDDECCTGLGAVAQ